MLNAILLILSSVIMTLAEELIPKWPITDDFITYSDFMIVVYKYQQPMCTGTLIRPKIVLTYCRLPDEWKNWKLVLGLSDNPYSQKRDVKECKRHSYNFEMVESIEPTDPFHTHDPLPVKIVSFKLLDFRHSWTQIISNVSQCYLIYLKKYLQTETFYYNWSPADSYVENCTHLHSKNQVCLLLPAPVHFHKNMLGAPLFCNKFLFAVLTGLQGKQNQYTFWLIDDKLDLFEYDYMVSLGDYVDDLQSEGARFGTKLPLFLTALNLRLRNIEF